MLDTIDTRRAELGQRAVVVSKETPASLLADRFRSRRHECPDPRVPCHALAGLAESPRGWLSREQGCSRKPTGYAKVALRRRHKSDTYSNGGRAVDTTVCS